MTFADKRPSPLARPAEPVVHVEVSKRMYSDLERLVKTGLYGTTVRGAARRLLEEKLIEKQWLIKELHTGSTP